MAKKGDIDDKTLWQHVTRSIRPLQSSKKPVAKPAGKTAAVKSAPTPKVKIKPSPAPALPVRVSTTQKAPSFNTGFDKSTENKMKKGKLEIEARIDLHGMTQDEAFRALTRFIATANRSGKRNLLVITGKGKISTGGILRKNLPLWLEGDARILALTPAAQKDGGSGAFYIRLRKDK